jgi:hypothetical protein
MFLDRSQALLCALRCPFGPARADGRILSSPQAAHHLHLAPYFAPRSQLEPRGRGSIAMVLTARQCRIVCGSATFARNELIYLDVGIRCESSSLLLSLKQTLFGLVKQLSNTVERLIQIYCLLSVPAIEVNYGTYSKSWQFTDT